MILTVCGGALGVMMLLGFLSQDPRNIGQPEVIGGLIVAAVLAGIPVLAGLHLIRRSPPSAPPAARASGARPRLGALRIIFVIIGMLIILFAGACALVLFSLSQPYGHARWQDVQGILILAGPPALVGIAILWAALRAGR